jgi:Zn finger protein HypA/HybF involved in hydrogenase expression
VHEVSLAEELVNECATLAKGRPVLVVAVRCPPGMGSSELSDSFAILAAQLAESGDACLRQAELRLEEVPAVMSCRCGFQGELGPDDVAGHIAICPECGSVGELGGGLELMAMTFSDDEALGGS